MAHTLLTFLGRVPKKDGSYRRTCYDFGDGTPEERSAFFGWPLQRRLRPDRLVILGTAGSMWDHLFEGDLAFGAIREDERLELQDAVSDKRVEPRHLEALAPLLSERLGCEVALDLIPYCRDAAEQVRLLEIMASHVGTGDRVDLDITHGFRHLPMVALLSALQLRAMRDAQISGIWYGAYDPDSGEAPVYDLAGLLHIADWLQALHTYDKDGDYGAFSHLLGGAGELLAKAAFFERTSNVVKAREALTGWASREDRLPAGDPAAALFGEELQRRVSWYLAPDRAGCEAALARQYLDRGDYVRAAIYGRESLITAEVINARGDTNNNGDREQAGERLREERAFRSLGQLRNAMAHGVHGRKKQWAVITVSDPKKLNSELRKLFAQLHLPGPPRSATRPGNVGCAQG